MAPGDLCLDLTSGLEPEFSKGHQTVLVSYLGGSGQCTDLNVVKRLIETPSY